MNKMTETKKKRESTIILVALFGVTLGALPMCVCLAAAETPLNDVVYAWDFSGPEGKDGKYNLIPNGACRLGVPAGFGKGECASTGAGPRS